MSEDKVEDLRNRALSGVRRLRHLELDILEAEILDGLMDGRKNAVELVAHMYGLQRGPSLNPVCARTVHHGADGSHSDQAKVN